MPEGNEVHRWAERHTRAFAGKKMHVEAPNGRFEGAEVLDGRKLERILAKGKHLGYCFGKDRIVHVHLGRYGDWTEGQMPLAEVKGALRLRMWPVGAKPRKNTGSPSARHAWYSNDDGANPTAPEDVDWLELRGPSDCSLWTDAQWEQLLQRLGPDPLGSGSPAAARAGAQPAVDAAGRAFGHRQYLPCRAAVSRTAEPLRGRAGDSAAAFEGDVEGCDSADAGRDGGSQDRDDQEQGPAAQDGHAAQGRGALCLSAPRQTVLFVRNEDFAEGSGGKIALLVPGLPGAAGSFGRRSERLKPATAGSRELLPLSVHLCSACLLIGGMGRVS